MSAKESIKVLDVSGCGLLANHSIADGIEPHGAFKVVCRDLNGQIRWEDEFPNLVVTAGKNDLLDKYFRGASYTASFFVGLKGVGTVNANDTMSSHAGWVDLTIYSNATRPAFVAASPSAGSTNNSASTANFNINSSGTVAGCFITTNNTVGGTTGVLFSAADFASARNVLSGDTLSVTYTISC